jgi:hypothetical protein
MANEMFTTRSGKQVAIPDMWIPKSILTSAMRLQEDLNKGTGKYTLKYVVILMLARGERSIRASLKQRAKTKTAKAVNAYIQTQLALGQPIDRDYVAKLNGVMSTEESVDEDLVLDGDTVNGEAELSDEQLDAATSPNGVA